MQTMSDQEAKDRFETLVREASRTPVTITQDGAAAAVLVGAQEYASMEETLHLLSTPANGERLRQGLADYSSGKMQAGELCD